MGLRYKSYCSNIVRTIMVDPNDKMKECYELLLEVEEEILKTLTHVKTKQSSLLDKMTKTIGFAMGLEFREGALLITSMSDVVAKKVLTNSKKRWKHVGIFLKDEDEVEEEDNEEEEKEAAPEMLGRGRRNAVLENRTRTQTPEGVGSPAERGGQGEIAGNTDWRGWEKTGELEAQSIDWVGYCKLISNIPALSQTVREFQMGDYTYLRVNFFHPGSALGRNEGNLFPQPDATFLKEM
ncbi:hypothetical protein DPMN_175429 [Dreissena polymorpha]|uniref:FACT complex subunit n=1 Tax=Dreissena polymorpha TaxID=45954 RepID=A0A9D4E793_DREPO|nr:hypothetical protein DPMN_175429 [Dreissena polymorpha]